MITEISIKNFRGMQKCHIDDLRQINLFIGKNNTGKSTVLESILLVSSAIAYPLDQIFALVNRRSNRSWHPMELWHNYDDSTELSVSLAFGEKRFVRINANPQEGPPSRKIVFHVSSDAAQTPVKILEFDRDRMNNFREHMSRGGVTVRKPDTKKIERINLPNDLLRFLMDVTLVDPIGKMKSSILEEEFQNIKYAKKYDETIRALKQIYEEEMRGWELFNYKFADGLGNRTAFTYEGGRPVYVDNLGDGVKYGFAAITLAHNRNDTALIVEEIETHQHPSSLRMLIEFLIKIAKENRLQLFVSTQNPDALRHFKTLHPDTKIFHIKKDVANDVVYVHDEESFLKVAREIGWDFGDVLEYEKTLLVDGIEDEIIVKNLFKKTRGYELESEGVKILSTRGGRRQLADWVRSVVTSPRKLIVVIDLDEMKTIHEVKDLAISWLKSLENEGWSIEMDEKQIVGQHATSGKRWKLLKSDILKAGNPKRFPKYDRHSITDYVLEMVLDNPKIASKFGIEQDLSRYELKEESSKKELEYLLKGYNMRVLESIVNSATEEIIPDSLKKDILMAIQHRKDVVLHREINMD